MFYYMRADFYIFAMIVIDVPIFAQKINKAS